MGRPLGSAKAAASAPRTGALTPAAPPTSRVSRSETLPDWMRRTGACLSLWICDMCDCVCCVCLILVSNGVPISYFAPAGTTAVDLELTFGRTPKMMQWLTKKLNRPFPCVYIVFTSMCTQHTSRASSDVPRMTSHSAHGVSLTRIPAIRSTTK